MNADLTAMNVWLAIMAIASLVEIVIFAAIGIIGYRLYRRASALIDRAESVYVAPLSAKVNVVVDEAQAVVRRAQQVEARVSGIVAGVEETASRVGSVAQYAWPVLGTWRAVSAAVQSFRGHSTGRLRRVPAAAARAAGSEPWPVP